jgi:hypothetical protein
MNSKQPIVQMNGVSLKKKKANVDISQRLKCSEYQRGRLSERNRQMLSSVSGMKRKVIKMEKLSR